MATIEASGQMTAGEIRNRIKAITGTLEEVRSLIDQAAVAAEDLASDFESRGDDLERFSYEVEGVLRMLVAAISGESADGFDVGTCIGECSDAIDLVTLAGERRQAA